MKGVMILSIKKNLDIIVYEKIKDSLIAGEYMPGQKLSFEDLVERYGVSRTPIVQAVKLLDKERILTIGINGRVGVPQYNEKEIRDTCQTRFFLEREAVRSICKSKSSSLFPQMRKAIEDCDRYYRRDNYVKSCSSDLLFHGIMVDAANNSCLSDIYKMVQGRFLVSSYVIMTAKARKQSVAIVEHEALINALEDFNEEKVLGILDKHVNNIGVQIITIYREMNLV